MKSPPNDERTELTGARGGGGARAEEQRLIPSSAPGSPPSPGVRLPPGGLRPPAPFNRLAPAKVMAFAAGDAPAGPGSDCVCTAF